MRTLKLHILGLCYLLLANFSYASDSDQVEKIGIFIGSYGDIDHISEAKELVLNVLSDPDVVPAPKLLNRIVAEFGWRVSRKTIKLEYDAIGGGTGFRLATQNQADAVASSLKSLGYWAKGYTGFNHTFPYIAESLAKAQSDGVEKLIVFYQGAQFAFPTTYILFRDIRNYLLNHPEWDVNVIGIKSFSENPRFINLIEESIHKRIAKSFPGSSPSDLCIFLPLHGNIIHWLRDGDPSYDQMLYTVDAIRQRFPEAYVSYGFQNHDEIPFTQWTQPSDTDALDVLSQQSCSNVVINGRISYTVDSLETLYDHAIAERSYLEQKSQAIGRPKTVVVEPMFNSEPSFVEFLSTLAIKAISGQGNVLNVLDLEKKND